MTTLQHALALSFFSALAITDATVAQCTTPSSGAYSQVTAPGCSTASLVVTSPPTFNTYTTLVVTNLPPNPVGIEVVVFAFGLPPGPSPAWTTDVSGFPLPAGCFNHIADAAEYFESIGFPGLAAVTLPIPASGLPIGYVVRAQAFPFDLGSFSLATATNSVCLHLAP